MKTAPKLEMQSPTVEALGGDLYKVSAIVKNTGFLPTYVSEQGKKVGVNKPVKASIDLADGGELVLGKAEVEVGHLDGRANQHEAPSFYTAYPIQSRAIVEWVVRQPGGAVTIHAECTKAGSTSCQIDLASERTGND